MNTFDFDSKKYVILLILICILFAICIIKAFDYLPDSDSIENNVTEVTNINQQVKPNYQTDSSSTEKKSIINKKHGVLYKSSDSLTEENNKIEEIDAPSGISEEIIPDENNNQQSDTRLSNDEYALQLIINARKYIKNGNSSAALTDLNNALNRAEDNEIKAEIFDELSILYAKNRKFGTALSFANKAYNASPTSTREFLIIRIFYSAGKTDVAVAKLNELLKRGF